MTIRLETLKDASQVRRVNEVAFGGTVEADLVDTLRAACPEAVSLVAEDQGTVVGHILFTPVNGEASRGMGLAPMAVLPERQRQGIGSALIHAGLALVRRQRYPYVVVVGHPDYYPRFGFRRASELGVRCEWATVPDEAFMVLRLDDTPLASGLIRYRPEFSEAK